MIHIIKFIHNYKDTFLHNRLEQYLKNMGEVLDVGCGSSSPLGRIKNSSYKVGVDLFLPSLEKSKKKRIHDKYVKGNILNLTHHFKNKSFDAVIAFDVIEHFSKKEGKKLMKDMEKISRKRVIIFTPNGFLKQGVFEDNQYQIHKSGWTVKEFQKQGYRVYGFRGLKYIRGEFASIKYSPWFFWGLFALVTEFVLHLFPQYSFHILAIKDVHD